MKEAKTIEEIVKNNSFRHQDEIMKQIIQKDIILTQSSLSRCLKKLNIVKQNGIYTKIENKANNNIVKFIDISPPNMLIIHTSPGNAPSIAYKIDQLVTFKQQPDTIKEIQGIKGTIAGDDTIFLAVDQNYSLELLKDQLLKYLY